MQHPEVDLWVLQAILLAQQGWRVNVYDSRPRPGNVWDAHSTAHVQNVVLGRRAQLCLERANALEQVIHPSKMPYEHIERSAPALP